MSPLPPAPLDPTNAVVAHTLHWLAVLLEIDEAPREGVEAWRQAAYMVRRLERPVAELAREGGAGQLVALGLPPAVAATVAEWIRTGALPRLRHSRRSLSLWPALAGALGRALGIARPPVSVAPRPIHHAVWESWN